MSHSTLKIIFNAIKNRTEKSVCEQNIVIRTDGSVIPEQASELKLRITKKENQHLHTVRSQVHVTILIQ